MDEHDKKHKVGPDGHRQDGVSTYPADAHDLRSFQTAADQLSRLPAPVFHKTSDPHDRLFVAAFDGTWNDAVNDPEHITNVGLLSRQINMSADANGRRIVSGYVKGVGTQENAIERTLDGAIGYTYDQRLEEMYRQFTVQAKEWLREDPQAQIRIADIGFSRGAEQAAGFSRLVHERGIQDPDGAVTVRDENGNQVVQYTKPPLVPPGLTPQAVGLFDPVGTGEPRDHDRRLPPSVVSGFQITAEDERRGLFKSTSIIDPGATPDGRFLNVMVGGAHSDVGGGYHLDGLSTRSGNLMTDYLNALSDTPYLQKRAEPGDPALNVVHRSEQGMLLYKLMPKVDRREDEGTVERLVPRHLAGRDEDHFNAQPRDERMAAGFEWRPVNIGPAPAGVTGKETPQMNDRSTNDRPVNPTDPGHPDHALYRQIEGKVHALDASMGRAPDEASARMTASLLAHLRQNGDDNGVRQVDHVVLSGANDKVRAGEYVIMVQGALDNPANRMLAMRTADAVNTSVDASFRQLDGVVRTEDQIRERQFAQQQDRAYDPALRQDPQQTAPGPHVMR